MDNEPIAEKYCHFCQWDRRAGQWIGMCGNGWSKNRGGECIELQGLSSMPCEEKEVDE